MTTNSMNLQQIKSQASLDQKLLIEKVEALIRSEYDNDELLKEVRKDYLNRVQRETFKIIEKYAPFYGDNISMRCRDNYQLESFFREIGDVIYETIEEYD